MHYLFYITYFALFAVSLMFNGVHAQSCQQPKGQWQNDQKSILKIESIDQTGLISGSYQSHEGTEGQSFPFIGWWQVDSTRQDQYVMSVSVYWKPYQTITSWTGYCNRLDSTIYTLWHHIDTEAKYDFQKWSTQSSEFKPIAE